MPYISGTNSFDVNRSFRLFVWVSQCSLAGSRDPTLRLGTSSARVGVCVCVSSLHADDLIRQPCCAALAVSSNKCLLK